MEIKEELFKLPSRELKELLQKNKFIKEGSLVTDKDLNNIYEVKLRKKNSCFIEHKDKFLEVPSNKILLLTEELFKQIKIKKYEDCEILNSSDKVINFLNFTLKRVFKDNFEVTLYKGYIKVVIYYPEIIVRNSLDMEHKMSEVYLTLYFSFKSRGTLILKEFSLFRTKYTLEEYWAGAYMFSHIKGYNYNRAHSIDWCMGYTEFRNYVDKAKNDSIFAKDVLFLIIQFHSYLQWESIEGVPFKRLTSLLPYNVIRNEKESPSERKLQEIYKDVISNLGDFTYVIELENNNYNVFLSTESKERIRTYLTETYPDLCCIVVEGVPSIVKPLEMPLDLPKYTIEFKGEVKGIELVESEDSRERFNSFMEINKQEIDPQILNHIVYEISKKFEQYFVKYKLGNL